MSISIATKGILWPIGGRVVVHERFVDIQATITDPVEVTSEVQEMDEIIADVEEL